jgi:hypothetical protein
MKNSEHVESLFRDFLKWIENDRTRAESMVDKLPPQDPCCVRSHVLKDVAGRLEDLIEVVAGILETPDA